MSDATTDMGGDEEEERNTLTGWEGRKGRRVAVVLARRPFKGLCAEDNTECVRMSSRERLLDDLKGPDGLCVQTHR